MGLLLGTSTAGADDVGVAPDKLLVLDLGLSGRGGKVVFTAKDAAISTGRAADVEGVGVRLHVQYGDGAAAAAFIVPGWGHLTAAGTVALAQLTADVVAQACGTSP